MGTDLRLLQDAEGQPRVREGLLIEPEQDVRLILVRIRATRDAPTTPVARHPRVVTGRDGARFELAREV